MSENRALAASTGGLWSPPTAPLTLDNGEQRSRAANFVGPAVSPTTRIVLHWGWRPEKVCGARMDRRAHSATEGKSGYPCRRALKLLKNDGPRDRPTRRRGEARGFRTVLGRVGARNCPASRAVSRFARWRGAPAVRDRGTRRGDQRAPPAVFSLSMLARGRSATRRLPRVLGHPSLDADLCFSTFREASTDRDIKRRGEYGPSVLPPPPPISLFLAASKVSFAPYNSECVQ